MAATDDCVLIAGGGPVGLVAALALAQASVPVKVFERNDQVLDDPRAATTHPPYNTNSHAPSLPANAWSVICTSPICL